MLLFSQPGASNRDTGRAIVSDSLTENKQGAYLYNGQIMLPTVGTKPEAAIDIITSRAAAELVANKFADKLFGRKPDDDDLRDFTDAVRSEVTETGQLKLGFVWDDREAALEVLRELIAFAQQRTRELGKEFARETLSFLEEEVAAGRAEVEKKSLALRKALTQSQLSLAAGGRDKYVSELISASNTIRNLMVDIQASDASLDVTINAIRKSLKDGVQGEAYTETTRALRNQVLGLKQKMNLAQNTLAGDGPEQHRISATFAATSKTYIDELERIADAAENRSLAMTLDREASRASLMSRLSGMKQRIGELREDNMKLVALELQQRELSNDLNRAELQLDQAITQLATARLAESKTYAPFVVLDPVYVPEKPVFPRKGIFTLSGLALGFFLGMFLYVRRLGKEVEEEVQTPRLAA